MSAYDGRIFVRVGDKGEIAFVRFTDEKVTHDSRNVGFEILWSCGGDRLSTGETDVTHEDDVVEMIEDGTLYEVTGSTGLCQAASA